MTQQLAVHGGQPVRTKPFTAWPVYGQEEEQALIRALRSGKWGKLDGAEVAAFERDFAKYQGAQHGIGVVNGGRKRVGLVHVRDGDLVKRFERKFAGRAPVDG